MPSSRLPHDLSVNATTRTLEALRQRGADVIDLTVSNPTRVGVQYPEDLLRSLASPDALHYDPHPLGLWSAREAVAADFARRGVAMPPERIALTSSTSEAYAWLFKLLCDPDDNVLVPQPSYPLFDHLTVLESLVAKPYRLEYHGTWRVDLDGLRHAVDARTRAVLVVSPNNPTGSLLHPDDLAAIDEMCAAHDLMLIADEVFADYPLAVDKTYQSVPAAPRSVVCSLGGLSKTVGLPQLKLAWIGFAGPADRVSELLSAYELIADTYLSVSTPVQLALSGLLANGGRVREQIQQRIAANYSLLERTARGVRSVTMMPVEAGWSAVLQVPRYRSEEALVLELLTEDHVLVHPGFFFDFAQEAFVVVSLLPPPAEFERGIARLLARASQPGSAS